MADDTIGVSKRILTALWSESGAALLSQAAGNRSCLTGPADAVVVLNPHIAAAAPVALWSQSSSFLWQLNPCRILQDESRPLRAYCYRSLLEVRHLRGTL